MSGFSSLLPLFWIVTLMIQEGQSWCGGPLPPVASTRAKPRLSPEQQGGGGLRTGSPRPRNTTCNPPGRGGGSLFNKTSKHPRAGRCVQTLNHPPPVRPMGCAVHGDTGLGGGSSPRGTAGGSCVILSLHQPDGPWHLPTGPAQRACFDFYSQFYGRTPSGALWAARHPCYGDRQCVSHECVSMRCFMGMK